MRFFQLEGEKFGIWGKFPDPEVAYLTRLKQQKNNPT